MPIIIFIIITEKIIIVFGHAIRHSKCNQKHFPCCASALQTNCFSFNTSISPTYICLHSFDSVGFQSNSNRCKANSVHTHTHCLYAVRLEILKIVFSHSVLLHFCRCCCWFCSFRYQNHQNHFEHPINCYATNNRDLNKARTTAKHTHTHRTHFDD